MIHRDITEYIKLNAPHLPVLCILGPRQAGKTTLARSCFPDYKYFSCDKENDVAKIEAEPADFLEQQLSKYPGIIIDEFQYCPRILPAIKNYVDETGYNGRIVLTGSQNYLMMASITESLAGRVMLIDLLPLSINELQQAHVIPDNINKLIFRGGYPRLYANTKLSKSITYKTYIRTYLERDIQTLQNAPNLSLFHKFLELCAGRIGQLLNLTSLAADAKIDLKTAQQWISLLENTYVIFLLRPHHRNFNKQLTDHPKLYFYDSGLAAQLLNIASSSTLTRHTMRGALFENFVISECFKWYYTQDLSTHIYFWRDKEGHEIDLLIDHAEKLIPIEIKSANTARNTMTDELVFWHNLTGHPLEDSYVIYAGPTEKSPKGPQFIPWENIPVWLTKLLEIDGRSDE